MTAGAVRYQVKCGYVPHQSPSLHSCYNWSRADTVGLTHVTHTGLQYALGGSAATQCKHAEYENLEHRFDGTTKQS